MADEMIDLVPPSRRAINGKVLDDLVNAMSDHIAEHGEESIPESMREIVKDFSPISCSNCMGRGHWADECPRRVIWFGQAQRIA